jgi:hypothetical protein
MLRAQCRDCFWHIKSNLRRAHGDSAPAPPSVHLETTLHLCRKPVHAWGLLRAPLRGIWVTVVWVYAGRWVRPSLPSGGMAEPPVQLQSAIHRCRKPAHAWETCGRQRARIAPGGWRCQQAAARSRSHHTPPSWIRTSSPAATPASESVHELGVGEDKHREG